MKQRLYQQLSKVFPNKDPYSLNIKLNHNLIEFIDDGLYQGAFDTNTYQFVDMLPPNAQSNELKLAIAIIKHSI